jgi:hypothetical protein
LSVLIYLGNESQEVDDFQGITRKIPRKIVLLNVLKPLMSLETRFQAFQGKIMETRDFQEI